MVGMQGDCLGSCFPTLSQNARERMGHPFFRGEAREKQVLRVAQDDSVQICCSDRSGGGDGGVGFGKVGVREGDCRAARLAVAADAVAASEFGVAEGFFGFAEDDERGASAAGGDADAGGDTYYVAMDMVGLF